MSHRHVLCVVRIPMTLTLRDGEDNGPDLTGEITSAKLKEEFRSWDPVTWKDEVGYGHFDVAEIEVVDCVDPNCPEN